MLRIALLSSLLCPSLLCMMLGSDIAQAREFYRWTEADGSITFSPTPPPAGTDYETVVGKGADKGADKDSGEKNRPPEPTLGSARRPPAQAAGSTAEPTPGTRARPERRATDNDASRRGNLEWQAPEASVDARQQPGRPADSGAAGFNTSEQDRGNTSLVRASGKDQHCRELAKRVVSLERRLATPLTPVQMDDTVTYMAKYQRNIDQFCSR